MPFERYWRVFFQQHTDSINPLLSYTKLFPENWQTYSPMLEAFIAGKAGRTEIIAHGTTIDPAYFIDQPYFPISPTLGCLCAGNVNPLTGKREKATTKTHGHILKSGTRDIYLLSTSTISNGKPG
jgi:hypothetical protein